MKNLLSTIAILFIALMTGCAKDDFVETIGICPTVTITSPANGTINVPLDRVISVTFNKEINAATVTQSSFTLQGTNQVVGTISVSGATATFTPNGSLAANTTYTAKINTSVKDLSGNAIQENFIWTFSTGGTLTPMVASTDPANNSTDVFLNKVVSAVFNMPMNQSTINNSNFTLKQGTTTVTGTVSYNGTTAFFTPSTPFTANTDYTATISGAKNVQGTTLTSPFIWTFKTGSTIAPKVVSTNPLDNATNVATNKVVSVTFSMPMDLLTLNTTTFTLKAGTNTVLGSVTHNLAGDTAFFTPSSALSPNTTYKATITNAAKSGTGISLANEYVWEFNTNAVIVGSVVNLGSAERFGILSGVGVSNNAGFSEIRNMDVGISPGVRSSITGFPPAIIVNGAMYASDDIAPVGIPAMLTQAKQDLTNAYLFVEGASYSAPITVSGDQGGKTLVAGIYKSTSTLLVQNGDLTLSGSSTDVWIFQVASAFTTVGGAGGNIILTGGAQAKNVYWQTGSSATIGDYTSFKGNILALQSVTMGAYSTAVGRMLARNGAVVMTHTNIITKP
ncbi:Ig-like domain-containing protein [Flavobacterium sp. K5-23]|uniref:Ig-like domain-containing protein n=1 Tax=Flavobacterium sp. K5-23 TaxID=2746225 RepID=UPI00200E1AC8|nr:Ig-like domain-containing protein [Flavobacterium sp. K5-23]